jgi:glycosyltransferase involved in cell wall biosynthesis
LDGKRSRLHRTFQETHAVKSLNGLSVGLVGPVPPPMGGMAAQTLQLSRLLTEAGAQVTLVPVNAPYRPKLVGQVPGLRALFRLIPYLMALWRVCGSVQVIHLMANSGWSWHLFAAPAIAIARLRRIPVIVNYRGGGAESFLASSHSVVAFSLRRVQALLVPTGYLKEVFGRWGWQAQVLRNVVDTGLFHGAEGRRLPKHLVVTRNLEPIYDNAGAIRAFAIVRQQHPDAVLSILGEGPELESLKLLAEELGLSNGVRFLGRLDRPGVADLLQSAEVLINPSLVDNSPNSIIEAWASGVPVVSTNVGGVPYLVQDGVTGLLVSPSDPQAMATAINALLEDSERRQALATAGLREVGQFTWAVVGPQLGEVYLAHASENPPTRGACDPSA